MKMNSKIIAIAAFAVGTIVGAAATWKIVKTKYEKIAQEEIDSVKEVFSRRAKKEEEAKVEDKEEPKKEVQDYNRQLENLSYMAIRNMEEKAKKGDTVTDNEVYVISPNEFGNGEYDYDLVTLTYYSDGVLTDDADDPILEEDLEDFVTKDFADHFGEYEDDSVYIRNERLKIDYEILRDLRNYSDVVNK